MSAIEERYRELQAEFTRRSQELAELRKKLENGELVDVNDYQERLRQWAQENPEDALAWLGIRSPEEAGTEDSDRERGPASDTDLEGLDLDAIPDDVFDPQSEVHKRLLRQYGERGLRRIMKLKYAEDLLKASPLGEQLRQMQEQLQALSERVEEQMSEINDRLEAARSYAEHAWSEIVAAKDPRVRTVQTLQEELRRDPQKWYQVAEAWDAFLSQSKASGESGTAEASLRSGSEPAEALATRQQQAQATSEGGGAPSPAPAAGYLDPWERAVAEAKRERESVA